MIFSAPRLNKKFPHPSKRCLVTPSPLSVKYAILCVILPLCGLALSCRTIPPDPLVVSDEWLDTPPRKAGYPPRAADGITHWNAGLPAAGIREASRPSHPGSGIAGQQAYQTENRMVSTPANDLVRHPYTVISSYPVYYRMDTRRRHGSHCHPPGNPARTPRQSYQRSVEKVGPPMVPRLNVPLVDRSLGTAVVPGSYPVSHR